MPAFVSNGPYIPETLLQAHEDGNVVFFCGSGISRPAGLRDFAWLVDRLFVELGTMPNEVQQAAINARRYDMAIGLLELDHRGGRPIVREAIKKILTPATIDTASVSTHSALLTLAMCRNGRTRLVTTNFDRLFEYVIHNEGRKVETYPAPMLPVPKNNWDGLVYLHGLLPEDNNPSRLDRLVVSSGDFGLAYLTERWASRFVSTLFRGYTVCFVGYSIDDPVLRYMTDALAADRQLGEHWPEMYAFGSYAEGCQARADKEWQAKSVTPILYSDVDNHRLLHGTLREWANTHHDGVRGKERIIVEHASVPPITPSKTDYAVGRVLWALTDELAAQRFANQDPVPPLKWLEPLSEAQFDFRDLVRFHVAPNATPDGTLRFSHLCRPTPYALAPKMCIADMGMHCSGWDKVMHHLARWMSRHLNDPDLVLWLDKQGGCLCKQFVDVIRFRMSDLDRLAAEGDTVQLQQIRDNAPNAIPDAPMRAIWRVMLAGRVRTRMDHLGMYGWFERIKKEGLTASLRLELREMLTPHVTFRKPIRWGYEGSKETKPAKVSDYIDWDLILAMAHVHSAIQHGANSNAPWKEALPELLPDFTMLLRDAMDLARELGGADDKYDFSVIHQPSIEEHEQNRYYQDWPVLIMLAREAWRETARVQAARALRVAQNWWQQPYPLFKRMAMFAAAQGDNVPKAQALEWLYEDNNWWLWSPHTRHEAIRLLSTLAPKLTTAELSKLGQVIAEGPPPEMYSKDEQGLWVRSFEHNIWLRLAKVRASGVAWGPEASAKLSELEAKYPGQKVAEDGRDELSVWIGSGDEERTVTLTPRRRRDLVEWLKINPGTDPWTEDDWRQRCRDNFSTTACSLYVLALQGIWPEKRWATALQVWAEEKSAPRAWRYAGGLQDLAPDEFIRKHDHGISWWLHIVAKTFTSKDGPFLKLCSRILPLIAYAKTPDISIAWAINHPVGLVVGALIDWWYSKSPKEGTELPEPIKTTFAGICKTDTDQYLPGRLVLAVHAIALFRVDESWATTNLLPLFDWNRSRDEACGAWSGFLWSPRLYRPLLAVIKEAFLATVGHYDELDELGERYAEFLAFVALDKGNTFTTKEMAAATSQLPPKGLVNTLYFLARSVEAADLPPKEYWAQRIHPYLHEIWPKSRNILTPELGKAFAELCAAAGDAFPDALRDLKIWLCPLPYPDLVLLRIKDRKICEKYPVEALEYLSAIINEATEHYGPQLKDCLNAIVTARPELNASPQHEQLTVLLRKRRWS